MRFDLMSGEAGAQLKVNPKDENSPSSQVDVVAIDSDIALAIECKSAITAAKRPQFGQELGKHSLIRERFAAAVKAQFSLPHKRQTVLALFLQNAVLSDNDLSRAKEANIVIFREKELAYYESLVSHLGPAAKYQLLADMVPGKSVPGLAIRIPAIRSRMGSYNCFTFSISPEYLLKISYVSHRSKGRASDVDTYQRMLKKSRLTKIKEYISEDGIFPTNIVIQFRKNRLTFERIHQDTSDLENGVSGWLNIRPAYKSAWIIDGQHRLFAYSGHEKAAKSKLSVLAFEGLAPSEQARLFIDINAKQKSVKQSLLQELYAELHWDADDDSVRLRAIISKAVQTLDAEVLSPLYQRVQTADAAKDSKRCISLTSLYGAIEKAGFHIKKERQGHILEYGPLWAGDNNLTLKRTVYILENWLEMVRLAANDWWEKGSAEGGGLSMNDGIITCINVLRSVFSELEQKGLIRLDNEDLFEIVKPYASALAAYLGTLSEPQRQAFRDLRGIQGQTRRTRNCQKAMRDAIPSFNPEGLDRFIEEQAAQTNLRGKEIIDRIEITLQRVVLEELRRECGEEESGWWTLGVPKSVRVRISQQIEEDSGRRGGRKESYFNLIDYAKIALEHWAIFQPILAHGKTGNKEAKLSWLNFVNEKRNVVSHVSSGINLSMEELGQLEELERWLEVQVAPSSENEADLASDNDDS